MAAFGATRMEHKIVKVPKHQIVVALGRAQAMVPGSINLEKDLAVQQQREQFQPRKVILQPQLADLLRRR